MIGGQPSTLEGAGLRAQAFGAWAAPQSLKMRSIASGYAVRLAANFGNFVAVMSRYLDPCFRFRASAASRVSRFSCQFAPPWGGSILATSATTRTANDGVGGRHSQVMSYSWVALLLT